MTVTMPYAHLARRGPRHRLLLRARPIEVLHTYEGTETIQTLVVGRDITGIGAFA